MRLGLRLRWVILTIEMSKAMGRKEMMKKERLEVGD